MARRLFSDLGPAAYELSLRAHRVERRVADIMAARRAPFAAERAPDLPVLLRRHNSLIRRRLGDVDSSLQEGKATNLSIAVPLVDGIVLRPGETFSFWRLVGEPSARRGFTDGLVISGDHTIAGVGGGMCQFTNLLHWLVLHSDLDVVEIHHHSELDLFPDFNRQIPFGTGTSIMWNYLDYRVRNRTDATYQFRVRVDDEYLRGELRADRRALVSYHIRESASFFYEAKAVDGSPTVRRHNVVDRTRVDRATGRVLATERVIENDALTLYDRSHITAPILPGYPG